MWILLVGRSSSPSPRLTGQTIYLRLDQLIRSSLLCCKCVLMTKLIHFFIMWCSVALIHNQIKFNLMHCVQSWCIKKIPQDPITVLKFRKSINTYIRKFLLSLVTNLGRGCGAVGRAVACNPRGPGFESSHRQLLLNIYLLLTVCRKDENKEKRGREWPI